MIGRLKDLTLTFDGKQNLTVTFTDDFREEFSKLQDRDLDIEIKPHRERRSKDANAYFHVLVNKIARADNSGDDDTKVSLVLDYGALETDDDGDIIGLDLPASFEIRHLYKYVKVIETHEVGGKMYCKYLVYKETHRLDSKEMYHLIEGAIYEAKQRGIDTITPREAAQMMAAWEARYGKA